MYNNTTYVNNNNNNNNSNYKNDNKTNQPSSFVNNIISKVKENSFLNDKYEQFKTSAGVSIGSVLFYYIYNRFYGRDLNDVKKLIKDEQYAFYSDTELTNIVFELQNYRNIDPELFANIVSEADALLYLNNSLDNVLATKNDIKQAGKFYKTCIRYLEEFERIIRTNFSSEHTANVRILIARIRDRLHVCLTKIVATVKSTPIHKVTKNAKLETDKIVHSKRQRRKKQKQYYKKQLDSDWNNYVEYD